MRPPEPMRSGDIAARLGITIDSFYRRRASLHADDGMPLPLCSHGRPAWDRASMEAWFSRFHPARGGIPANDPVPPPDPVTVDEHRARFARAYGAAGP